MAAPLIGCSPPIATEPVADPVPGVPPDPCPHPDAARPSAARPNAVTQARAATPEAQMHPSLVEFSERLRARCIRLPPMLKPIGYSQPILRRRQLLHCCQVQNRGEVLEP